MHETADLVMDLLRSLDPSLDLRIEETESHSAIHLPPSQGADYRFVLYIHEDGEPQIAAVVVDGDPESYFWYWPFEEPEFSSVEERHREFLVAVKDLLGNRTRIRQKRGWLNTHFRCEIENGETWSRVGPTMAGLKWSFKPPPTEEKVVFYQSPPLVSL
jgi:hypothetical protein